jgi:hypothetical protein
VGLPAKPGVAILRAMNGCPDSHRPSMRFVVGLDGGPAATCLRHAALSRRFVRTSLPTALVVGTILTLINQGTVLFGGSFPPVLYWKVPLTYSVPFLVSTWSQLRLTHREGPALAA